MEDSGLQQERKTEVTGELIFQGRGCKGGQGQSQLVESEVRVKIAGGGVCINGKLGVREDVQLS